MLLSVQFPFADSRAFLNGGVKVLGRPTWPSVSPDSDFVRSFGSIRSRRLGGLSGWVGESALCEAGRALRFSKITNFKDPQAGLNIPLSLSFRRFFFDGLAVGKFEVGITISSRFTGNLVEKQTSRFINYCLDLPVIIPALSSKAVTPEFAGKSVATVLGGAGKPLARFYSGSSINHPPPAALADWWVRAGTPLLFLVHKSSERIHIPYFGKLIPRTWSLECDLSYFKVPYGDRSLGLWVIGLHPHASYKDIRSLKLCLLRLHAEHESMRLILQNIATNKIEITPRTSGSNTLQRYFNEATRRISRLGAEADKLSESNLAELARASEDMVNPGERDALLDTLKNFDVRKNIFDKVEEYVHTKIIAQEVFMGDTKIIRDSTNVAMDSTNVVMAADNATASNNGFNTWNQSGGDLKELAKELALLRAELGKNAKESADFESAAAVAKAEAAAEKGDGPGAFEHLKSAGKWALKIAEAVGVPVAIGALKAVLGG